ncbi:N-acetylglucosamine transport system permease protein [Paenibacillus endophyticus]|uniref:N-acetylglucosamine transport system permease protein n=1 Tax=Paenibacillus endophyticus TaxID=1294268 RepID=A0A7W5C582_9BACL|nr:carbohydrate ABC transporter permease [Paenibacillus endophyticus]MBB3151020.1 N-acetylglucosamine transport system permease protein [Paenibacillus endophyticus]
MMLTKQNPAARLVTYILLLLWTIAVVYPMVWTLFGALKDNPQFMQKQPWALPEFPLLWQNFTYVWERYGFQSYFANSILVTVGSILLSSILAATTAYVLARFAIKGGQVLYYLYLSAMMIPMILGLIPLFFLLNDMGLINSIPGLILVYTASALPFGIFVLVSFFKTLPKELEEAAYIDGAGYARTFWSVMLPLARSGLISVGIMNGLTIWNEYIMGSVFVNKPELYTLPVGLAVMQNEMQYRTEWGPLFAGLLLSIVPVLIIYIIFQRQIAEGVTAGAVK